MKKLIDLHHHLETLQEVFQFRSKVQHHLISLKGHIRDNHKTIISVAMYVQFYQSYDDLIDLIRNFRNEVIALEEVKLIETHEDLDDDFKLGIILHIESGRTFENVDEQIPEVFELGVRGIIPVHFHDNKIGVSCDAIKRRFWLDRKDPGLSEYGQHFVALCNKHHLWLDLAHCTDKTAQDILNFANHSMVSHVAIRDLVDWKRNFPIKFFKKLQEKQGVFGITPWQHLIGDKADAYQYQIQFALEHELENSLCIGSDFGAPIATHENYRSIFDLEKAVEDLDPQIAQKIKWNNAYQFLKRSLPSA